MTHIKFFRRGGFYYGFEETGHTGFGESGDDILCSALSAMTMLIINTIEISYAQEVDYEVDEGATRISVKCMATLPDYSADEKAQYAISGLFQGYFFQLNDLVEEYYDFLEVEEVDD
ncbi:MAG: ribosomal-processing cysteine protease Prp [Clostridia bacterium]|nr:ribosomal-processing cysteine protease Prp [Clostridia bacterium]